MKLRMAMGIGIAVVWSGCSGKVENQDRIDAILLLTGDPAAGDTAYQANCADCHGAAAEGGTGPAIAGYGDPETMAAQVLNGGSTRPAFASLSDQTIADIIAWTDSL